MEPKKYVIGDETYTQQTLVFEQINQLSPILEGVNLGGDFSPNDVIKLLGKTLPKVMAIVLCPENVKIEDKDLDSIEHHLAFHLDIVTTFDVVEDFFDCSPVFSLVKRFEILTEKFVQGAGETQMPESGRQTKSKTLSAAWQKVTSQKEK